MPPNESFLTRLSNWLKGSSSQPKAAGPAAKKKAAPRRKPAARKKPAAKKAPARKKPTAKAKTREQLYKEATRLKISGRTKMSKAQLQRAVNAKKK
jgi:hypothetical protein